MTPPLLIERALDLGLGVIAVTDHNAAENCAAVVEAAVGTGVTVLPGMEVQTAEEVHVLCWFDTVDQAQQWQRIVFDHLPYTDNLERIFGTQCVVNARGERLRREPRLLLTSTDMTLSSVVMVVRSLGGLSVPAHVDRPSFSVLANLGFIPQELSVPALEISRQGSPDKEIVRWPCLAQWSLIRGSDAHRLSELTPSLRLFLKEINLDEIALALTLQKGRWYANLS